MEVDIEEKQDYSLLHEIKQLVCNLPQRQKEVFILRHWHGFSTKETADLLSIGEGSVKSHLSRAIDKIKLDLLTTD